MRNRRSRFGLIAGALAVLFIFFGMVFGSSLFENMALKVLSPITAVMVRATDALAGVFGAAGSIRTGFGENERLKQENEELTGLRGQFEDVKKENELLRGQLQLAPERQLTFIEANVASFDPLSASAFILIDRGQKDGIAEGMPVVRPGNVLVGKISKVYSGSAHVMLLADKSNKVSVKSVSKDTTGVLAGADGNLLRMDLIEKNAPLEEGELVVTSGLDGFYPKSLIVGWITNVIAEEEGIFKQAHVKPAYSGFSHTQVFVISDYLR